MQGPILSLSLLLLGGNALAAELELRFSALPPGQPPPGFRSTVSGLGQAGDWRIVLDEGPTLLPPISERAPVRNETGVLAQLARDRADEHYPLLIYEDQEFDDFTLTTQLKLVKGEVEQMAGIAFRIQDERNYYYVRASSLEGTFYFWKLVDGIRSPPIGAKVEIPSGLWHKLTLECRGSQIRVLLNDRELIPTLNDKSFGRGKIGFWTKSDTVAHFSDVKILFKPKEIFAQRLVREILAEYPRLQGLQIYAPGPEQRKEATLVASGDPEELGQPATAAAQDVIARGIPYHGKERGEVTMLLPLHDRNGDIIAAVSVIMKGFPGQTEKNALARALPIVQKLELRVRRLEELFQ